MVPLPARLVRPDEWRPSGVESLEANAMAVVRSDDHRSVIAGPGAGKTELLAQRAAWLLQTGVCRAPRRILAISFKRDAARNLAERVARRCHPSQAGRLDSLTFDAFAKSLLDRFGRALPDLWRPPSDYAIMFPGRRDYDQFLTRLPSPPERIGQRADVMAISADRFEFDYLVRRRLDPAGWAASNAGLWAAGRFWRSAISGGQLTFSMIGRLAELLVRLNPMVRDALRLTYSHLFMDEFQDTTPVQFDLVRTIYLGSETGVTAVGDNKQQIMRWANAMADPFGAFERVFEAQRTPLLSNYRSSPALVRIQHVLARALDVNAAEPVSQVADVVPGPSCEIWDFASPKMEADVLAAFVAEQLTDGLLPRDVAVLVRQKAGDYERLLRPAFAAADVALRNEAGEVGAIALQDLLAEEASDLLLTVLRAITASRAGRRWTAALAFVARLRGLEAEDDAAQARLSRELDAFGREFRRLRPTPPADAEGARAVLDEILALVGRKRLIAAVPAYAQGDWFERVLKASATHLAASARPSGTWAEALDVYEGLNSVPLMTIHKSKGLEYHTVVFVGLDDGAWWSYDRDAAEATAGFFVAFTRAKQRVVFTYCAHRGTRTGIKPLYDLLATAGVATISKP